jgi:hypothetical protein
MPDEGCGSPNETEIEKTNEDIYIYVAGSRFFADGSRMIEDPMHSKLPGNNKLTVTVII